MVDPEQPEQIVEQDEENGEEGQSGIDNLLSVNGGDVDGPSHSDTNNDATPTKSILELLDPPLTPRERSRNSLLRLLDRPEFQVMGMVVLFLVVADGALFFFFLMGWQTLCDDPSKVDCEPRNQIYNISVQILTGLFTYMATVSMPWRFANVVHVFGGGVRDNSVGLDLYGRPTNEIWFHIGFWNRAGICVCLLLNCLTQYCNQVTRIIFHSYELQDTHPGSMWVNVFFISSMIFAGIAFVWVSIVMQRIRRERPGRFGPGILEVMRTWRKKIFSWVFCCRKYVPELPILTESEERQKELETEEDKEDPTRYKFHLFQLQRAGLRLFGL